MPIPPFDHNQVLPPHLGDPRSFAQLSPYPATSEEVCRHFATSPQRKVILLGLLAFRARCIQMGIAIGFQWLDGSFLENIEQSENRSPRDLDVVTFFEPPSDPAAAHLLVQNIGANFPDFLDSRLSKANFHLDHFPVNLRPPQASALVENTRYWTGLFSHRRNGIWKGMLRVDLNTAVDDATALSYLATVP